MSSVPRRGRLYATVLDQSPDRPKPRVAFCHGLFGQGKNWTSVARQLTDGYTVVLLDMPNHGRSGWTDDVSYPGFADQVADYLADSSAPGDASRPWTVVGHSMGGKIAMMLALRHPELVQSLCVVDIAPVDYSEGSEFGRYVQAMRSLDLRTLPSRAAADDQLRDAVPSADVRGFLLQNLRRGGEHDGEAWHWQMNLQLLGDRLDVLAGWPDPLPAGTSGPVSTSDSASTSGPVSYPGPTLWVAGAESDYVRPEHAAAMRALFPQARTVKIKNARHWVHSDQPEVFTRVLRAFLDRTAATDRESVS